MTFFVYFGFWVLWYLGSALVLVLSAEFFASSPRICRLGRYSSATLAVLVTAAIAAGVTMMLEPLR